MAGYNVTKSQRALPVGSVQPWGGNLSEIPNGWLLCNGAEINAGDYPLLARIIRDSYGGTGFEGNFPNYSGTIRLPQTNNKAIADISTNYFGAYNSTTGTVPSPIDNEEALTVVEEFIGDSVPGFEPGDLSPPTVVNAKTDLNFTYTPDPQGTIVNLTTTGTAPTVALTKIYKNVTAVNGTNSQTGLVVTGSGAEFTVVLNTDNTYDVVTKVKGSGYKVSDRLTISGTTFAADGGASPTNNIEITITQIGNSFFTGTIAGQSLIPGFSIKEVYIVPRKLGRLHFPQHIHEDQYSSINTGDNGENPGRGSTVWLTPEVNMREHYNRVHPCPDGIFTIINPCPRPGSGILQCAGDPTTGFYIGNSPTQTITAFNTSPFQPGVGRFAIASIAGSKPINDHRPYLTEAAGHGVAKTWFIGSGSRFNLRDKAAATSSGSTANKDGSAGQKLAALKQDGRIYPGYTIPFSDSATTVKSPNFDDGTNGSDNTHGYTKTLFNHAGVKFTNETQTGGGVLDLIEPHDHDGTMNIKYDGTNLEVTEELAVQVQPNVVPDSLTGALQVKFITTVPSLSITNLIRAY
jgi:hypothetical protein